MPVDAQCQQLLDLVAAASAGRDTADASVEEARAGYAMMLAGSAPPIDHDAGPVASVDDITIPGPAGDLAVRIYRPRVAGARPTVVFFHGGGWTIGSVDTHDGQARLLCEGTDAIVVSVDYRLAPESPFPAALDDCDAATRWVFEHAADLGGRADSVAVAGDSAGGNLAGAVALRRRDRGDAPLAAQLLIYGVFDASRTTASYATNAEGYFLTARTMAWFWANYLGGAVATAESSLLDAEDLAGLPPAVVVTAEYDPLRDEGNAYAARLAAAGVPTTLVEAAGLIHGFFGMTVFVEAAAKATDQFLSAFRAVLDPV